MNGSDQGMYNNYSAINNYWADTTAFDNLRGPGHAGEFETILRNNKKNFASGHSVHTPTSEVVITNRDHRPDVGYGTIKSLDTGIF